jgi:pyridoxine 5-phosphate synthase
MTKLSVNLNKVALLRNARTIGIPSVTRAAHLCIGAGAHGITVHPRPDERHIRRSDVYELKSMLTETEFNIEGNPFHGLMDLVRQVRPTQCTLVPDAPEAFTSDHGWDLVHSREKLIPILHELRDLGIRSSLFLDPVLDQVELAKAIGADRIELYTEPYAAAHRDGLAGELLPRFARAAGRAQELGLGVNAGHDLNLDNLGPFCRLVPGVLEVSIGHALIADALEMGLPGAVRAYRAVLAQAAG